MKTETRYLWGTEADSTTPDPDFALLDITSSAKLGDPGSASIVSLVIKREQLPELELQIQRLKEAFKAAALAAN